MDRPHLSGGSSEDSTNRRGMPRRRRMVRRPVADDNEESALISPRLLLRGRYRRGGTPARWAGLSLGW